MLVFIFALRCLTTSNLPWFTGPSIQGFYEILFFTATDFTFTTTHMHNWVSFLLWPSCSILSGAVSNCPPLFPSSILDTFWPGGLIFQCHIFLPFHTVHGLLNVEYWSELPFPPPVDHICQNSPLWRVHLGGPAQHSSWFHWVTQAPLPWQGCGPRWGYRYRAYK